MITEFHPVTSGYVVHCPNTHVAPAVGIFVAVTDGGFHHDELVGGLLDQLRGGAMSSGQPLQKGNSGGMAGRENVITQLLKIKHVEIVA